MSTSKIALRKRVTLAKPPEVDQCPALFSVSGSPAKSFGTDQHYMVANLVKDKLIHYGRATWRQNHMQARQASHLTDSDRRATSSEVHPEHLGSLT